MLPKSYPTTKRSITLLAFENVSGGVKMLIEGVLTPK